MVSSKKKRNQDMPSNDIFNLLVDSYSISTFLTSVHSSCNNLGTVTIKTPSSNLAPMPSTSTVASSLPNLMFRSNKPICLSSKDMVLSISSSTPAGLWTTPEMPMEELCAFHETSMSLFLAPGSETWIRYLDGVSKTSTEGTKLPSAFAG